MIASVLSARATTNDESSSDVCRGRDRPGPKKKNPNQTLTPAPELDVESLPVVDSRDLWVELSRAGKSKSQSQIRMQPQISSLYKGLSKSNDQPNP